MRTVIIAAAAALLSSPAFTQQPSQDTASITNFSGMWGHNSFPSFEPPSSGPGPVVSRLRLPNGPQKGRASNRQYVGDYSNPILKTNAAEIVKKNGEIELSGGLLANPRNQCWPEPLPFIFMDFGLQILQQSDKTTILYLEDHEVRHVRMNEPHPSHVKPSWYGDSVGHYEGDTLVIDTVGIKADRPFAMVDWYGTPYTGGLHVVERYRLLDYEAAKEALERDAKENFQAPGGAPVRVDRNYRGKHLQLQFTVEDEGVFTMPWSATVTYRPMVGAREWPEIVCAENPGEYPTEADAELPHADKPDF
jgi:hypothetical protein